jgi:hypothetical protein
MHLIDKSLKRATLLTDSTYVMEGLQPCVEDDFFVYYRDLDTKGMMDYLTSDEGEHALRKLAEYVETEIALLVAFGKEEKLAALDIDAILSAFIEEQHEHYNLSFVHLNNKTLLGNAYANRFQAISVKDKKFPGIAYDLTAQDRDCPRRESDYGKSTKFLFGAFTHVSSPKDVVDGMCAFGGIR